MSTNSFIYRIDMERPMPASKRKTKKRRKAKKYTKRKPGIIIKIEQGIYNFVPFFD